MIKRLSSILFHLTWPVLVLSAAGVFVALHRNLFGPSGENMDILRGVWEWFAAAVGRPNAPYPPENSWSDGNVLRPSLTAFVAAYAVILFLLRTGTIGRTIRFRSLALIACGTAIPLLLMPHIWSSDVFDYIIYGRLPIIYQANPYTTAICEFPKDPFYNMTCWKSAPSVYGPAWSLTSIVLVVICKIIGGTPAVHVWTFKLFAFACHLASAALIWRILGQAGNKTRAFGTAVYLFNPLVLIEFAGNAHNEALMITMLLLGLALAQRGRWALAAVALTVAVQTKFYMLPALFIFAAYRWWREPDQRSAWLAVLPVFGIFAAVSFVLYLPFGLERTTIMAPFGGPAANSMTKSLAEFFVFKSPVKLEDLPYLGVLFAGNHQEDVQRMALFATFLLCVGWAVYARSLSRAVTAMALFTLFWSCIGATWFMPWYLTVGVALAPLTSSRSISYSSVLASILVLLIYLLEGWSYANSPQSHNFMVRYFQPFIFGPPLALLLTMKGVGVLMAVKRIGTLPPNSRPPASPTAGAHAS